MCADSGPEAERSDPHSLVSEELWRGVRPRLRSGLADGLWSHTCTGLAWLASVWILLWPLR